MPLDRRKLSVCHVGQKALGLDDDAWRALLARVCGVTSSRDLTQHGFENLMAALEAAGWKSAFGQAHGGNLRHWSKATPGQIAVIRDAWRQLHDGALDAAALDRWLSRFGADSIRFLTRDQARRALGGLKGWQGRVAARATEPAA